VRKCPYCDFNSHVKPEFFTETRYLESLLNDLNQELPQVKQRQVESIFLGGGTPGLFSGTGIDFLLANIRSMLELKPDLEITLETNPNSADAANFTKYRKFGINRISIGAQSFARENLTTLGRMHTAEDIYNAVKLAKKTGFDNINLDLMFGLPGQTRETALVDLQQAIELNPQHISWYQLTIEPNTSFFHSPPILPDADDVYKIQNAGIKLLTEHGYNQYEVSAFSRDNFVCRHNLNYWQFGDYIGIGAGAHSKLSFFAADKVLRYNKNKNPDSFMQATNSLKHIQNKRLLTKADLTFEFMLNALRLKAGFSPELFCQRTGGILIKTIESYLKTAQDLSLLQVSKSWIKPSKLGYDFLNDLINVFAIEK